jgi:protein TonB
MRQDERTYKEKPALLEQWGIAGSSSLLIHLSFSLVFLLPKPSLPPIPIPIEIEIEQEPILLSGRAGIESPLVPKQKTIPPKKQVEPPPSPIPESEPLERSLSPLVASDPSTEGGVPVVEASSDTPPDPIAINPLPGPASSSGPVQSVEGRLQSPTGSVPSGKGTLVAGFTGIQIPFQLNQVDRLPEKIAALPPPYPDWARNRGLEGVVTLSFVIDSQGNVEKVLIEGVEGDARFGEAARQAVAKWRFRPAILAAKPVAVKCSQRISFNLDG